MTWGVAGRVTIWNFGGWRMPHLQQSAFEESLLLRRRRRWRGSNRFESCVDD